MNPFAYDFMVHAYLASVPVALLAGAVGYVLVLRGQSFAGHALGHVGFAGAAAGLLLGAGAWPGLLASSVAGGMAMGLLGAQRSQGDVAIGMVLSVALGLGLLFLSFYAGNAQAAMSLLFGNVLAVDAQTLGVVAGLAAAALLVLAAQLRPLLFASLQPELAAARGVRVRLQGMVFLGLTGLAVAGAAQIVGVLLIFTLLVAPAATAQMLTPRLWPGLGLSVAFALLQAAGGITLAFYTDWPVSFWISALGAAGFGAARLAQRR